MRVLMQLVSQCSLTCVVFMMQMLIYFFSDRNYVRSGFYARYSISSCRQNCSGHGECVSAEHQCRCFAGYVGSACEQSLCAEDCHSNGGQCSDEHLMCECPAGRVGYDCGLSVQPLDVSNAGVWSQVLLTDDAAYKPRAGHAAAVVNDCLYVFGGTTLNYVVDDLVVFCVSSSLPAWRTVGRSQPWPASRHSHAMCAIDQWIFLFGGVLHDSNSSNELWMYDVELSRWQMIATSSVVQPPTRSGHSMTAVDDRWLYVVGGRTSDGEFVSDIYILNVDNMAEAQWQRVHSRGGREAHHRLVGHSAVFHADSRSLLVFGGFSPENARFPRRSALLLSYHVDVKRWVTLSYDTALPTVPRERSYHAAVIVGNYMLIHGGQVHVHHEDETCYDAQLYVYHLYCHVWVDFLSLTDTFNGMSSSLFTSSLSF